jgi:LmbE family N-acetylglucosaminyl deacetylase
MRLDDLHQIQHPYQHVYLSPHLDDAALSCGGAIVSQLAADEPVLVVTLATASPPPEGPFNAVAQEFHADWGLTAAEVMDVRLAEEARAMATLGVDYLWVGLLDAIYRMPADYRSRETVFAAPVPHDPLLSDLQTLLARLRERLPRATFYAPLGVGSHVDHLITFAAARAAAGPNLAFYEDVHYVLQPGRLEDRLAQIELLAPRVIAIDEALPRKIEAIACYPSQIGELFGGAEAMAHAITTFAATRRPAEGMYGEQVWEIIRR